MNTKFQHDLDVALRKAQNQNLTLNQVGVLAADAMNRWDKETPTVPDAQLRNRIRALYLSWREGRPFKAVFPTTIGLVDVLLEQLTQLELGKIGVAPPGGTRPSELIRKTGPVLFYNGKKLYKAGNRTGRGPRRLYEIRPGDGKAVDWREQLRTIAAGGKVEVAEVASGKDRATRRKSQNKIRGKRTGRVVKPRVVEAEPQRGRTNGAAPPVVSTVDTLLEARSTLQIQIRDAQGQLEMIDAKLQEHLTQIQEALTQPN